MSDLRVTVGADISAYQEGMRQAAQSARQFDSDATQSLGQAARATESLGGSAQSASMRFMQMRSGISAARDGVMAFTLGGQAAERSLLAMGHHINSLVNETGSFKGALGALASSLVGPGGIILALSVAAELFQKYEDSQKKAAETQSEFQKANQAASETAGDELTKVTLLYDATQNLNLSHSQRLSAVKELQSLYPAYFGNLSQEAILAGKAAGAYDALTTSLFNKAAIEGASSNLKELFKQLSELKSQQIQIKSGTDETSQKYGLKPGQLHDSGFIIDETSQATGGGKMPGEMIDVTTAEKKLMEQIKNARQGMQAMLANVGIGSLISKDDINQIDQIRAKIKELQLDILAHPENKDADLSQIKELKKQLEELNPSIKKAKDGFAEIQDEINKISKSLQDRVLKGEIISPLDPTLAKMNEFIEKLNVAKLRFAELQIEFAKQQNIKETGSVYGPVKTGNPEEGNNLKIDDSDYQKEQLKNRVDEVLNANAKIRTQVEANLQVQLIDLKTYYQQIYFLEVSDIAQKQKLYSSDSAQYAELTNRKAALAKKLYDQVNSLDRKEAAEKTAQMMEIEKVFGAVFVQAANEAISGQENFFSALGKGLEELAIKLAETAAEAAILYGLLVATGLASGTSFTAIYGQLSGLGKVLGSGSSGGYSGGIGGITAFATGGLVTKPTKALIGEAGPEAVIPLDRMKEFHGGGSSAQTLEVTHKLSGADLLLTITRAQKQKSRLS